MEKTKMYVVTYDNEMQEFNRIYTTRENAVNGIKKTVDACRRDWENVSAVYFKDYSENGIINSATIYLQEEDWEEKVNVEIAEMIVEN